MKRRLGIVALLIAQVISGINNPLIRYALETMPIFLFGFLRVSIALLVIGPIAYISRKQRQQRKRAIPRKYLLLAVLGTSLIYGVANLLFYVGVHQSTSINAAVIELLQPIIFFTLTIEVLKEKFSPKVFAGILLAFIGALFVVIGPMLNRSPTGATLEGNLLLFIAVVADVVGTVILKKVLKKVHIMDVLVIGLFTATVLYFMLAAPQLAQLSLLSQPAILGTVLYGAIVMGCMGYGLNYFALQTTRSGDYSILGYVTPVVTMVVATFFFHETFTLSLVFGGVMVFIGLYMVEARKIVHFHGHSHSLHK